MADTTVTVRQDGTGDYTTISSAEAAGDVSSGYYKIEIDDSSTYNENVTISVTGTGSSSNYVWLTVSAGNRHAGIAASSGHARITGGLTVQEPYTRIEYLDIDAPSTGIYIGGSSNANYTIISRCIIHDGTTNGVHCVSAQYCAADHCVIYGFGEYGVMTQEDYAYQGTSITYDYCVIAGNGDSGTEANARMYTGSTTNAFTECYFYNVAMGGTGGYTDITIVNYAYYANYHGGSNNAWDTNTSYFWGSSNFSYTNSYDISSGDLTATTTTANAHIVTSLTSGSENFTPAKATGAGSNLLLGNGSNRIGSEPDPRQDFSVDIRGKARSTTAGKMDIGAFQISGAAGFKYYNGSAFVDASAVQYYNGSAWVDVSGIQYYNGSAWTDPS